MADSASGPTDRSVQVKLVLLGQSLHPVTALGVLIPPQVKLQLANRRWFSASYVLSQATRGTAPHAIFFLFFFYLQVSNEFQPNKEPTIGAAFLTQKCRLEDRVLRYEIWDTAGQERFHSLAVRPLHTLPG